jgi:hypothetical protein
VELDAGVTIVGRGEGCQLVLDDPLVSRQHACFVVDAREVTVKDLRSTNGVLVNGTRVDELRVVVPGDLITLGHHQAELCLVPWSSAQRIPARAPQQRRCAVPTVVDGRPCPSSSPPPDEVTAATGRGTRLGMLWGVAEKAFELGRGEEALRMLARPLEEVVEGVEAGATVDLEEIDRAALLALRLARQTGDRRWVAYVFRLFGALARIPSSQVVDQLHHVVRSINLGELREYRLRRLESGSEWSPAERILLRRHEGIESMIS